MPISAGFEEFEQGKMYMSKEENTKMLSLIRTHSDAIMAVFSGHTHADTFKLIYDEGKCQLARSDLHMQIISYYTCMIMIR